jgi:hypothetical protein
MPKNELDFNFSVFSPAMQEQLTSFCQSGGNLFISGAYVGTDVFKTEPVDSVDIRFARNILKYFHRTNHAVKNGNVVVTDSAFHHIISDLQFNTSYHKKIYIVEAPDAIEPADSLAHTIFRYRENNMSAAVAYRDSYKVIIFGFPFEAILDSGKRTKTMAAILNYFSKEENKTED